MSPRMTCVLRKLAMASTELRHEERFLRPDSLQALITGYTDNSDNSLFIWKLVLSHLLVDEMR